MLFLINPLDVIGVIFGLAFAYPWALMLIPRERRSAVVLAVTTLALSLGGLTLWMMALALVGALRFGAVVAGIVIVFGIGQVWLLRTQAPMIGAARPPVIERVWTAARQNPLVVGAALVVIGIAALIVFNTLYWPFNDDDAVSIYATQSLGIYQTGHLPKGEGLYEAYPMLLPLSHVYSYMVAGQVDEYLARIAVAALGVGTLAAACALGRALYDTATGLSAAVLLALTPAFTRWASSGYTDIPAAFFVTLAVMFAGWFYQHGGAREAFLFGVMTGLAAWTKNSALALGASMVVWVGYVGWQSLTRLPPFHEMERGSSRGVGPYAPTKEFVRLIVLAAAGLATTAGPWYLRNLVLFGRIVPRTIWSSRAQHTVANLVPFATDYEAYFLPGLVFTAGFALVIVEALRRKSGTRDQAALLLIGVIPFAAAWWWAASYETRFLLTVLPLFAVMGGHGIVHSGRLIQPFLIRRSHLKTSPPGPLSMHGEGEKAQFEVPSRHVERGFRGEVVFQLVMVLVLVALALPAAQKAVIFKSDIIRDPLMSDVERHQISIGPIYDVAQYLNTIPAEGQILSDNYFLPFHVNRAGRVEVVVGGLPRRDVLAVYTYLVYSGRHRLPGFVEAGDVNLLVDIEGYRVYEVLYR
jgi:hypothetical protein